MGTTGPSRRAGDDSIPRPRRIPYQASHPLMNACIPVMNISADIPAATGRKGAARTRLAYGQIFSRHLEPAEALRLRVDSGHLWVTMEGSREDHLITAGEALTLQ